MNRLTGWYRQVRWYLRELTGESGYEHYLARHPGGDRPVMTRREYERHRTDLKEHTPQTRCC